LKLGWAGTCPTYGEVEFPLNGEPVRITRRADHVIQLMRHDMLKTRAFDPGDVIRERWEKNIVPGPSLCISE